jgi:Putative oxidoreductase C terminal domain
VLADKPAIIKPADLPRLEVALALASDRHLVLADMMTGRHNTLLRLLQALRSDPEAFGEPVPGTADEPGVFLSGAHYLHKVVAGLPNPRPAWYFDVTDQGEGLADTGVHLVDRVHETLFPEQALDWQRDIDVFAASRWPTSVSLAQFRELTGEGAWPEDLAPWLREGVLEYFCNGRVDYRVRGIHVRLEVRWDWQAEQGDDTHHALYRGTRCGLAVRQGPATVSAGALRPARSGYRHGIAAAYRGIAAPLSQHCHRGCGVEMADRDTRQAADRARRRFRSLHPTLSGLCRRSGLAAGARETQFTRKIPGDDRRCLVEPRLSTSRSGQHMVLAALESGTPILSILLGARFKASL